MDFSGHKWGLKFGRPGRVSNRRFKYVPRFYDEDKEEFEFRVEQARKERDRMQNPDVPLEGSHEDRMRKAMEFRTKSYNSEYNAMNKFAGLRRLLIVGILVIIFYLIFSSDVILRIFDAFYGG